MQEIIQKVKNYGPSSLTAQELLLLILNQLTDPQTAQIATQQFFHDYQTLPKLALLTPHQLKQLLPDAKAQLLLQVICAFSQKLREPADLTLGKVTSSQEIGHYLQQKIGHLQQEVLVAVFLNTKNQIIHEELLFKGTLNAATVHPREIFKTALLHSTSRIIIGHNHPSGDVTPSKNDQAFTERLVQGGELIGIGLLDHLIVSSQKYFSFREKQMIKSP